MKFSEWVAQRQRGRVASPPPELLRRPRLWWLRASVCMVAGHRLTRFVWHGSPLVQPHGLRCRRCGAAKVVF